VCFCASILAQTKLERGAASGLTREVAEQINFKMSFSGHAPPPPPLVPRAVAGGPVRDEVEEILLEILRHDVTRQQPCGATGLTRLSNSAFRAVHSGARLF
jgi:hypothetical protein